MYKAMVIFGTWPEAIKLFPVINVLKAQRTISCEVLVTAQHREMLDQVLSISGIAPDHELYIMQLDQALDGLTVRLLEAIGGVLDRAKPDRVIVQATLQRQWSGHWQPITAKSLVVMLRRPFAVKIYISLRRKR